MKTLIAAVALTVAIALLAYAQRPEENRPPRPEDRGPREPQVDLSSLPKGTVVFRGGHETDRVDGGRPVVLIAAALGVKTEVFREAFSGVTPAQGRGPTHAEAQANKRVLMAALGKYGVTNERLDEVSNYYRYRPQNGELWKHQPAQATAIIENGAVTGFKIINAGAGYSSPPHVQVTGYPNLKVDVTIEYGQNLVSNGQITALKVIRD